MVYTFTEFVEESKNFTSYSSEIETIITKMSELDPNPSNIKMIETDKNMSKIIHDEPLLWFLWSKNPDFCRKMTTLDFYIYSSIMDGKISHSILYKIFSPGVPCSYLFGNCLVKIGNTNINSRYGDGLMVCIESLSETCPQLLVIYHLKIEAENHAVTTKKYQDVIGMYEKLKSVQENMVSVKEKEILDLKKRYSHLTREAFILGISCIMVTISFVYIFFNK
jgi:hypothetical protein